MICSTCGHVLDADAPDDPTRVRVTALRPGVAALARAEQPGLTDDDTVSAEDAHRFRMAHLEQTLLADREDPSAVDQTVLETLTSDRLMSENVDATEDARMTVGDRIADRVASFGGSWTFILSFFTALAAWIAINVLLLSAHPFDPYPFILLNLVLSCLAAIQAPVIMMSQNRKEARDRDRATHDYQVNLKAEIEVRMLHEKLDHLMVSQWSRLLDVQEDQGALLDEVLRRLDAPR